MINKIETIDDVNLFSKHLLSEGVSFHPDDDFSDYINFKENTPLYTKDEADLRNTLMNMCFEVCENQGIDIYDTMLEVTLLETGLDALIPLPSLSYPNNN